MRRKLDRQMIDAVRAILGLRPLYENAGERKLPSHRFPQFEYGAPGLDGRTPPRGSR
jgi:hypothetical protein